MVGRALESAFAVPACLNQIVQALDEFRSIHSHSRPSHKKIRQFACQGRWQTICTGATECRGIQYYRSLVSRIWERIIRGAGIAALALFFVAALTPASNIIGKHIGIKPAADA